MKRKVLYFAVIWTTTMTLMGCGSNKGDVNQQPAGAQYPKSPGNGPIHLDSEIPVEETMNINDILKSGFVDERSGKVEYDSYDEVVGSLEKGEYYAYVTLYGSDQEILLVTNAAREAEGGFVASGCDVYITYEGKVRFDLSLDSKAKERPIKLDEDNLLVIYDQDNQVNVMCSSPDNYSTNYVTTIAPNKDEAGNVVYEGYSIVKESVLSGDYKVSDASLEEEYNRIVTGYEQAKGIAFTKVE